MVSSSDPISAGLMLWGGIGLAVAVVFLLVGFDKLDPAARDAYAVRPLLLPGLVLLWPLVVWGWIRLSKGDR